MSKFYIPEVLLLSVGNSFIVYPCEGIENLVDRNDRDSFFEHFSQLYDANGLNTREGFDIAFLFEDKGDLMTDVCRYSQLKSSGSGASIQEQTFRTSL